MSDFRSLPILLKRKDVMYHFRMGIRQYYRLLDQHPELLVTLPGYSESRVRRDALVGLIKPKVFPSVTE